MSWLPSLHLISAVAGAANSRTASGKAVNRAASANPIGASSHIAVTRQLAAAATGNVEANRSPPKAGERAGRPFPKLDVPDGLLRNGEVLRRNRLHRRLGGCDAQRSRRLAGRE